MSLIKCPECGKEISDKASSCPNCGMPLDFSLAKQEVKENKSISTVKKLNKKMILTVLAICLICVTVVIGITLKSNRFYELSAETIGTMVSEKDIKKYLNNDAYVYSGDMLEYTYEESGVVIKRTILLEDNSFPTMIIGVGENYGYTYGELFNAYDTKLCDTADECQMISESQFKKQLEKAMDAYGDNYVYNEETIGYGTRENYKWYFDNGVYYSLSISKGTKYYPGFNQYIISYGYFLD